MVTENEYGLGAFNGDIGVVIDSGGGRLRAVFDRRGEVLEVRPTRLASVESLYAMTIHKAQGSQFHSVVVVPHECGDALARASGASWCITGPVAPLSAETQRS